MAPFLQNAGQKDAQYPEEHLISWYRDNFDSYWSSNLNTMLPLCLDMVSAFCGGDTDNQKAIGMLLAARMRWVVDLRDSLATSSSNETTKAIGEKVPRFITAMCHNNDYVCNNFDLGLTATLCENALAGKPATHQWLTALRNLCSANGVPIERNSTVIMECLGDATDEEFSSDNSRGPMAVLEEARNPEGPDSDLLQWHAEFVFLLSETVLGSNPPEAMLVLVHSLVSLEECIAGMCMLEKFDAEEFLPRVCIAASDCDCIN